MRLQLSIGKLFGRKWSLIWSPKMRDNDAIAVDIEDGSKDSAFPCSEESVSQFAMRKFIFRGFGE